MMGTTLGANWRLHCAMSGCPMTPQWQPMLMLPRPFPHRRRGSDASALMAMAFCELHRRELRFDNLVNDAAWGQLLHRFAAAGRKQPDRSRAWLNWRPLSRA